MPVMRLFTWTIMSLTMLDKSDAYNTTACFAEHGCNSFNLMCQGDQKIQITGAEYRYIHNATNRARDKCCPLNINDCKANYSYTHAVVLFTRCSGKTSCSENLAPTPTANECQPYDVKKYIYVSYDCIPDHNILDMCQDLNRQAAEVDIIFQGTRPSTNTTATCVCYVQSQHTIYYELIDVRLFTNVTGDGAYICLSSNFSIDKSLIKCQHNHDDRSFIYINSPKFTGEISAKPELSEVLRLTFTRDAKPEMGWVKLKADGNFTVYCNSRPSTTSTGTTTTEQGKDDDGKALAMIIGVIVAVIVVIAVVAVPILIFKRRQKLHTEDNNQMSDLPTVLTNHEYKSCKEASDTYAVVETSNYESINDKSAITYSQPIKRSKETRGIHESTTKYGDISAGEYDRIDFEMKGTIVSSNYDFMPVVETKVGDDTYSHASNQSQSVTTAKSFASDYSHCKPSSKDTLRNDDDYSHADLERDCCKPNSKDTLRNEDDYSHVDLEGNCKNNQQPNTYEDSSYNHIDFDITKHPVRNEKAIIDENESQLKKNI